MNSKSSSAASLYDSPGDLAVGLLESLEPRLLLAAAPVFNTDLADFYALNPGGGGVSVGIDGFDEDGDPLTVSIMADDSTGLRWEIFDQSTSDNRYAVLHFTESDGVTPIGAITVQLFEDRSPLAAERFITLATHYFDDDGNPIPADDDNAPFYTDVIVHRVIDEFMFQTGDAVHGDGTGGSPLGVFDGEFHADLSYAGRGVLAMANTGPDHNDSQWFITATSTPWLDGGNPIFGQIVSGWDVYDLLIAVETDENDRPLDPPLLASVDIVQRDQSATITLVADETFTGPTELTITLSDTQGNDVSQVITVMPDPALGEIDDADALPGEVIIVPLAVTFAGDEPLTFETASTYTGDGDVILSEVTPGGAPGEYELQITLPAEYDGRFFEVGVYVYMDQFDNGFAPSVRLDIAGSLGVPGFQFFGLETLLPQVGALDDVYAEAGQTVTVDVDIAYAGERDLEVAFTTQGYPGGELAIPDPAVPAEGDPWVLQFDLPGDYDGTPFTVTASAKLADSDDFDPSTQSFTVAMETPQVGMIDDVPVVPGEQVVVPIPVTYDGPHVFTVTAADTYDNGGVWTLEDPVEDNGTYALTLNIPAEYDGGEFTVTITAALDDYPHLDPSIQEFTLSLNQRPIIAPPDDMVTAPGATAEQIILIVDSDTADADLTVEVTATDPEAVVWIDPELLSTLSVTAPISPAEATFDVTISVIETKYVGTGLVEPTTATLTVTVNLRPEIFDDTFIELDVDETFERTLTILDVDTVSEEFVTAVTDVSDPDASVSISPTHKLTVTPPAGFVGVFSFTVTVVEAEYEGIADPGETVFYVSTLGDTFGISEIDDILLTPLDPLPDVLFTVTYPGTQALEVAATTDYEGEGEVTATLVGPAGTGEGEWTLQLGLPAEYAYESFTVTIRAFVEGFEDGFAATEEFTVIANQRPQFTDDELIELNENQWVKVFAPTIVDEDSPDSDIVLEVDADSISLPGATVVVNVHNEVTITVPEGYEGVFSFTLRAVEEEYRDVEELEWGSKTFYVSSLHGQPILDEIDDVTDAAPGVELTVDLPVTFEAADATITVEASTDYDNGGELDLTGAVIFEDGQHKLRFAPPAEYNGESFTVTVTVTVDGFEDVIPAASQTFAVWFGERPMIDDPDVQTVIAGQANEVQMAATHDETDEFHWEASADDPEVVVAIDGNGLLTITPPAGAIGQFEVTVTVVERDYHDLGYDGLTPGEMTFTVYVVDALPVLSEIDPLDLPPGGEQDVTFTVDYAGAGELTIVATDTYAGELTLDDPTYDEITGAWTLTVVLPANYNGLPFEITLTPEIDGTPVPAAARTFQVAYGQRPTIENPGPLAVGAGQTVTIDLTILDPDAEPDTDYAIYASVNNPQVTISVDQDNRTLTVTVPNTFISEFQVAVRAIEADELAAYPDLTSEVTYIVFNVVQVVSIPDTNLRPGATTDVSFEVRYDGEAELDFSQSETTYDGPGTVTLGEPTLDEDTGKWTLPVTIDAEYDGRAFDVTVKAATAGVGEDETMAGDPATATFHMTAGSRPRIHSPGAVIVTPGVEQQWGFDITDIDATNFTVGLISTTAPPGVVVEIDEATQDLKITAPAGYEGQFEVTVAVIETGFAFTAIPPATWTVRATTGAALLTVLADTYALTNDGRGLTLGLDMLAADGQAVTVTATSSNPNVTTYVAQGTRFAELVFTEKDGTQIGTILVQLFDDRSPEAVERFVTLATETATQTGYDLEAQRPFGQTAPPAVGETPFYTDVPVHRVIPGFMIQTGDARNGDGTGSTGLGSFEEQFGPNPFQPGNLSFAGPGALAFANRGAGTDTSDGQFFITQQPTPHLNDAHVIFGQVISGWEVYNELIYRQRDQNDRPVAMPLLASVDIIEQGGNVQDASVTVVANRRFNGSATITLELDAGGQIHSTSFEVVPAGTLGPLPTIGTVGNVELAPGGAKTIPLDITNPGNGPLDVTAVSLSSVRGAIGATIVPGEAAGQYLLHLEASADFDGAPLAVVVLVTPAGFGNVTPAGTLLRVSYGARPRITNPGLMVIPPGGDVTRSLAITGPEGMTVTATVDPDAVAINPDLQDVSAWIETGTDAAGDPTHTLKVVTPAGFEGIIPLIIEADTADLGYAKLTAYVSTLRERPVIDEIAPLVMDTAVYSFTLPVTDDSGVGITYTIEPSYYIVVTYVGSVPFGPAPQGFSEDKEFTLVVPDAFFGVFQVRVTAVETDPYAEEVLTPTEYIINAVRTDPAVEDPIGVVDQLIPEGEPTAVAVLGDLMFIGLGSDGVAIYSLSDPASPVLTDTFGPTDGFIGKARSLEVVRQLVDGRQQTVVLIAAEIGGLVAMVVDDDGMVVSDHNAAVDRVVTDLAVRDNIVYAACLTWFDAGLATYDLSDLDNIRQLDYYTAVRPTLAMRRKYQNFLRAKELWSYHFQVPIGVELRGNYAIVIDQSGADIRNWYGQVMPSHRSGWMAMVDIRNPANLQRGGMALMYMAVSDTQLVANRLYLATENGLSIFDVSNVLWPRLLGRWNTDEEVALSVSVANQTAIVTTPSGYQFIDVSNPRRMAETPDKRFYVLTTGWLGETQEPHLAAHGTTLLMPAGDGGIVRLDADSLKRDNFEDVTRARFTLNDTPVTVRVLGGGTADVTFDGFSPWIDSIAITGATPRTVVRIITGRAGPAVVREVTVDGPISAFLAPSTNLIGDFTAGGSIGTLVLGDVGVTGLRTEQTISLGPAGADGQEWTRITLGSVFDARLTSEVPIRALTLTRWLDNEGDDPADVDAIIAPSIGRLTVRGARGVEGDFQADLILNADGAADGEVILGPTLIRGSVSESIWQVHGDATTVAVIGRVDESAFQVTGVTRFRFTLNDTPVIVQVLGGGAADVTFDGLNPWIDSIAVVGATPRTVVRITTGRAGPAVVREITLDGPIRAFMAPSTNLVGDFTADGSVGALVLGDVGAADPRAEQTISLGPAGADGQEWTRITLGSVFDARLTSQVAIRALVLTRWLDDEGDDPADVDAIVAPSIGRLTVRGARGVEGDFQADLILNADGAADGEVILGPTLIRGSVSESVWRVYGDATRIAVVGPVDQSRILLSGSAGPVAVGGMLDSDFYAGYLAEDADAVTGLPTTVELAGPDFDPLASIRSFAVRGLRVGPGQFDDSFVNSNIAAAGIGPVLLRHGRLDNDGDPFGLTAQTLTRLTYRDADIAGRWVADFPSETDPSLDDLVVRIV